MKNEIMVCEVLDSEYAVSIGQGSLIFETLSSLIHSIDGKSGKICLNFSGISICATPFFNASVSRLLGRMDIEQLKSKLEIRNISIENKRLLNISIANAIEFYEKQKKVSDEKS
ncbi:DUF4325 domain-containing protein [Vibrio parahaemolyticus]|nr:DUF4325 domain-containing protein [Vibrio parahaemolyticus]